jgi:hypothetical protein
MRFRRHIHLVFWVIFLGIARVTIGQDWTLMSGVTDRFLEIKALSGTDTLIVSTEESGMYWTGDVGDSWHEMATPGTVTSHEIFYQNGGVDILVTLTTSPYLMRSSDMGQTWAPASSALPNLQSHRLHLDRYGRLWTYYGGLMYFSDDHGINWDSVQVSPQVTRVWDVWVSPQDSSVLWLAAEESGAYFSNDRGMSWSRSFSMGDVRAVEGNPQNPRSAISVLNEDHMYWNHGTGLWEYVSFPITGRWGDLVFLDNDSTRLLAVRGYVSQSTTGNIYRSDDCGLSWIIDLGDLISGGAWRIQSLCDGDDGVVVLLCGGAFLGNCSWNHFRRLNIGKYSGTYRISRHAIGHIWAWAKGGTYISANAGTNWICTPDAGGNYAAVEHTGRMAMYTFCDRMITELISISYPSLRVDALSTLPESIQWIESSEGDTSLLYCLSCASNLYASRNGGRSWEMVEYPGDISEICIVHPSSTVPGFAFMTSTIYSCNPYSRVWRTYNYGESWELVYRSAQGDRIVNAWSGADALSDFNFTIHSWSDEWYYYTLDGGNSFDSLLTSQNSEGYVFWPWGDSVSVICADGADSIFITPDRGQTLEFRVRTPEGLNTVIYDGPYSQLVGKTMVTGNTYYYGPYTGLRPQNQAAWKPHDFFISIYPNPTNSSAFLNLSGLIITDPIQIRIYDILGRLTRSCQLRLQADNATHIPLPFNNLSSGTYFVVIENPNLPQPLVRKILLLK